MFPNIFRITDDLCPFNNDEFENYYNYIYLVEFDLKKGNEVHCKSSFLDLLKVVHEHLQRSFLINEMPFTFISITFSI